jgi:hypothetical protein
MLDYHPVKVRVVVNRVICSSIPFSGNNVLTPAHWAWTSQLTVEEAAFTSIPNFRPDAGVDAFLAFKLGNGRQFKGTTPTNQAWKLRPFKKWAGKKFKLFTIDLHSFHNQVNVICSCVSGYRR